jgi:hypothetical protein
MRSFVALESGTWADWANAIATTLAFTVALVLFAIGLRDRRRAAEDRLRDQARKVWIWPVSWTMDEAEPQNVASIRYRIINDSDEPISNGQISIEGEEVPANVFWFRARLHVLPGRESIEHELRVTEPLTLSSLDLWAPGTWSGPPLQLDFTDAAGIRWLRQSDGLLELISRPSRRRRKSG